VVAVPLAVLLGATVPHVTPVQEVPVTLQVTPLFCGSFVTVAVNCTVVFACTLVGFGEITTEIGGPRLIVKVTCATLVLSATEVAVNVTKELGLGTLPGAV